MEAIWWLLKELIGILKPSFMMCPESWERRGRSQGSPLWRWALGDLERECEIERKISEYVADLFVELGRMDLVRLSPLLVESQASFPKALSQSEPCSINGPIRKSTQSKPLHLNTHQPTYICEAPSQRSPTQKLKSTSHRPKQIISPVFKSCPTQPIIFQPPIWLGIRIRNPIL